MKCLQYRVSVGGRTVLVGETVRVSDDEARELHETGHWYYCPKVIWKATRKE